MLIISRFFMLMRRTFILAAVGFGILIGFFLASYFAASRCSSDGGVWNRESQLCYADSMLK